METKMSKLTIVDLTTEVELSSADMNHIGGGMTCDAAAAVASVDSITSDILGALGDYVGQATFAGRAQGVYDGGCRP
jgi:hypothetical protein